MIPRAFIDYASEILGETDGGLTGSQIAKLCLSYSIDMNVAIPYSSYPFPSDLPNKRTALRDNLFSFSPEQQYKIISSLCDHDKFKENKQVKDLKIKLISQFGHLVCERENITKPPIAENDNISNIASNNNILPVFLDIIPTSIIESRFRYFEAGDFETKAEVDELIVLLFEEPECPIYYFSEKGKGIPDSALRGTVEKGDLLMNETEFFYYKHPNDQHDYVRIETRDGNYRWDWQKAVVEKGPMFMRTTVKLSSRKRLELETIQKVKLEQKIRKREKPHSENKFGDHAEIKPEPPTLLKNLKWFAVHGRKHYGIILFALMLLMLVFIENKYSTFSNYAESLLSSNTPSKTGIQSPSDAITIDISGDNNKVEVKYSKEPTAFNVIDISGTGQKHKVYVNKEKKIILDISGSQNTIYIDKTLKGVINVDDTGSGNETRLF